MTETYFSSIFHSFIFHIALQCFAVLSKILSFGTKNKVIHFVLRSLNRIFAEQMR